MLRLAVIFESSPFDRKGLFNAVHNRIKHLLETDECWIDAYCVHAWDTGFSRRMRSTPCISERTDSVEVEGITYRMLWYDFSLTDYVLVEKLHAKPFFFAMAVNTWLPWFKEYDCIVGHSFTGGLIAEAASEKYGIPYYISWHGSDIHTHPWRNPLLLRETVRIMSGAKGNFFVSRALMEASERIVPSSECSKEILYNGVAEEFVRFPDHCRTEVRRQNGLSAEDKLVAFVGSIVAVKNVSVLQPLFHEIRASYEGPLKFWMVGNGKLRGAVESAMIADPSIDVSFWGNVPSEHMPSVMNCIDVMVLPSLNEGLPLVCAEAIRCGATVIGSDAGGISEVIGRDSVVSLDCAGFDRDFVSEMASRVVQALDNPFDQTVPSEMDWTSTARKELSILTSSCH